MNKFVRKTALSVVNFLFLLLGVSLVILVPLYAWHKMAHATFEDQTLFILGGLMYEYGVLRGWFYLGYLISSSEWYERLQ